MKKISTLFAAITITCSCWAQTDVISGLSDPTSITKVGDKMYVGQFYGTMQQFDLTNVEAGLSTFIDVSGSYRATVKGDELFYTEPFAGKISKISLVDDEPTPVVVVDQLEAALGIASNEEYVYYSVSSEYGNNTISRVRPEDPSSNEVIYDAGLWCTGICLQDDALYFIDDLNQEVHKIDLNAINAGTEVIADGFVFATSITCSEESLIVSDFDRGSVVAIDLTQEDYPKTNLLTDVNGPTGTFLEGDELYVSVFFDGKVIKYTIRETVSVDNFENVKVDVYPNPTSDMISVSGLDKTSSYQIIDFTGKTMATGEVGNGNTIDLVNLPTGTYVLVLDNGPSATFVKK